MPNVMQTRRGYHLLFLWCYTCHAERPFNRVEKWRDPQPRIWRNRAGKITKAASENVTPGLAPDARLIRGHCMVCDKSAMYIITDGLWEVSNFKLDFLCACGLPWDHTYPHLIDLEALHADAAVA